MRVALLTPGPSLRSLWAEGRFAAFDWVIAVNTAAWLYRCHWHAAHDWHSLEPTVTGKAPRPLLGWLTARDQCAQMQARGLLVLPQDHLALPSRPIMPRCGWTFPNAVAFASLAAGPLGHVEIYGMDFDSNAPCCAAGVKATYTDARWASEARWCRDIWPRGRVTIHGNLSLGWREYLANGGD